MAGRVTPNPWLERGRQDKAASFANMLQAEGYTSTQVAGFWAEEWAQFSAALSAIRKRANITPHYQKPPSYETQMLIVQMLRQRENAGRLTVEQKNQQIQEALQEPC